MDKSEFITLFNKRPFCYTDDEIYEIGIAHRSLPLEDRDWSYVAQMVGWGGNGESLRCYIKARMKRDGILPKNTNQLTNDTVENITEKELLEQAKELLKQRQRVRDEWTAYRRVVREDARVDSMKEMIQESIRELNKLPEVKYERTRSTINNTEAVLMLSDLHIGVECDNFYNKYNSTIARKRVNKVVEDTISYCKRNGVAQLNIVNLGDMIHGIIHTSARVEQELDVVNQIILASEILASAVNKLQESAPRIVYRSVIDNHSRAIASKEESIDNENFNKIIDWFLKERLKGTSVVFADDNIDDGIGKFNLLCGKSVMFAHGHQDRINQAFQHFVGASRGFIDYILLGHYHCEKTKSYQGTKVIVNGSVVGTEQYALSKRLFSSPSQTLLIFEDGNLIDISIDLSVD